MKLHDLMTQGRLVPVAGKLAAAGADPSAKAPHIPGGALPMRVRRARAYQGKHLAICEPCATPADAPQYPVVCNDCDKEYASAEDLPERCQCNNPLRKYCVM